MFRTKHRNQSHNLAARMGRWSAAHWKTATFGWLAFVAVAFALGGMVGTKSIDPNTSGPGESGRMDRILDAGFKQPAGESVLIQSRSLRVGDPAFTAAIDDVVARMRAHGAQLIGEMQYEDTYRLAYIRGPEGIIVALSEQLG